jgi:hypothetical protein
MVIQILSILIGGFVTWLFAWIYYKKAGDELRAEARDLRSLVELAIRGIKNTKFMQVGRDKDGKLTVQFVFEYLAEGGMKLGGSAPTEHQFASLEKDAQQGQQGGG